MLIPASSISFTFFTEALSPVSPVDGGLIVWGLCVFGMCVGLGGVVLGGVGWVVLWGVGLMVLYCVGLWCGCVCGVWLWWIDG